MNQKNRGFTLVEALIAIVIVAVAAMSLLLVVPFSFNNVHMNATEIQAVSVGQQFLDDERNAKLHALPMPVATAVPIDPGQSFVGGTTGSAGSFTIAPDGCATVQSTGLNTNVYSCSVAVTWTESNASRSVTVQSYVTM